VKKSQSPPAVPDLGDESDQQSHKRWMRSCTMHKQILSLLAVAEIKVSPIMASKIPKGVDSQPFGADGCLRTTTGAHSLPGVEMLGTG